MIPTPHFKHGKRIPTFVKSSMAASWCAMVRSRCLTAAGIRCHKIILAGGLIVGDSGSFLDSQRLKGIHLAMKSGMLAAETIFESLKKQDYSANTLKSYKDKIDGSYIKEELWKVRNFHQSFSTGLLNGFIQSGVQQLTGGRGLIDPMRAHPGYEAYGQIHGRPAPERFKGDGKLTFDRLTDVYHSARAMMKISPAT